MRYILRITITFPEETLYDNSGTSERAREVASPDQLQLNRRLLIDIINLRRHKTYHSNLLKRLRRNM